MTNDEKVALVDLIGKFFKELRGEGEPRPQATPDPRGSTDEDPPPPPPEKKKKAKEKKPTKKELKEAKAKEKAKAQEANARSRALASRFIEEKGPAATKEFLTEQGVATFAELGDERTIELLSALLLPKGEQKEAVGVAEPTIPQSRDKYESEADETDQESRDAVSKAVDEHGVEKVANALRDTQGSEEPGTNYDRVKQALSKL